MRKKNITDLDDTALRGKRALVRLDLNVPLDDDANVTDDTRIRASVPTLRYLLDRGARPVILSHLGRPKGKPEQRYSLEPVCDALQRLLGAHVTFVESTDTDEAIKATHDLPAGAVLLLENTRFLSGEESNDARLARSLAELGDLYVNDAFGAAHRAHASTAGVAAHLHPAVAGLLMEKELGYLGNALAKPVRPFVAILGGAKISGKIDVLRELLPKVDALLIGGAMACTFYKAMGLEVGTSLLEPDRVDMARALIASSGTRLILPHDAVVARSLDDRSGAHPVGRNAIPADEAMYDIGPRSAESFSRAITSAKTVLWNGPMGVFEKSPFDAGTRAIATAMADATRRGATTIVGGGDSAAAIASAGLGSAVSHVSTGGGLRWNSWKGRPSPVSRRSTMRDARAPLPIFAANWKMNHGPSAARGFMHTFVDLYARCDDRRVLFFPPALSVAAARNVAAERGDIQFGVQNIYWADRGAFTGELSGPMARDAGATYVLVGHSERRHIFGETDQQCADKCAAAERAGLTPLLCVGETLREREEGRTESVVVRQVKAGLASLAQRDVTTSVIAYEPVWAIGTGRTATPDDAAELHAVIRNTLGELIGDRAEQVSILYGGSVTPANARSLLDAPHVDGLLVGGASLDPHSWLQICQA